MGENNSKISVLDDGLINKIAAGEVVEEPSSVVKELIENSIDANADEISIEVTEGGKSRIYVKDNGDGMSKEDAEMCVKRHATSKIKSEDDLFAIKTLGFRGEALASICAVSRFMLVTKRNIDLSGTCITIEGNNLNVKDIGCEKGTSVDVRELFYNVPARKKFMKTIEAELGNIIDVVTRYALAYPKKSFILTSNEKAILSTAKSGRWLNTIQAVYGSDTAKNVLEIAYENELVCVNGYIGKPSIARNDKTRQTLFVNGRYVRSKEISNAVKDAYHSLLFLEREPMYVLSIWLDESKVDVNVHPRKEIVKISNSSDVCEKVRNAISEVLKKSNLFADAELRGEDTSRDAKPLNAYAFSKETQTSLAFNDIAEDKITPTGSVYDNIKSAVIENMHIGPFKIMGQINKEYIIAENAEGLLIIDQHAAEERVNYEKMLKELRENAIRKQQLIQPIVVETSAAEFEKIISSREMLERCGFEIDEYGKNNIIVRTMPFVFERPSKTVIFDLINELKEGIDSEIEERIIRFSCRKSIKAGEEMTAKQVENLINELDKCDLPFTCPHGRPTVIKISLSEIEKKFKRR